jgi:hypothetical protein
MAAAMRPDKSKVILESTTDGEGLVATVDPGRPGAWREGPVGDLLSRAIDKGIKVVIVIGKTRTAFNATPQNNAV